MSTQYPRLMAASNLFLVLTALFCFRESWGETPTPGPALNNQESVLRGGSAAQASSEHKLDSDQPGGPLGVAFTDYSSGEYSGSGDLVQTGIPPKPSIWADPGPRVPMGSSVTIWCQGPPEASNFCLYKERDSEGEFMEESPGQSGQAYISLQNLNVHRAGQYQCSYSSAHHPEQRSDNLTLVLTGSYPAPSLEAHPSPVVASGRSVSLSCSSPNMTGTFYLLKEGGAQPQLLEPQFSQRRWQANFSVGPVNASHGGNYSCFVTAHSKPYSWSLPSTPLRLQVTGLQPPDYTVQNLIRIGTVGCILLILALLLIKAYHSKTRSPHTATR